MEQVFTAVYRALPGRAAAARRTQAWTRENALAGEASKDAPPHPRLIAGYPQGKRRDVVGKKVAVELGPTGQLARIAKLTEGTVHLDFPDGHTGSITTTDPFPWSEGQVLLLTGSGSATQAQAADASLWPAERRIGTVRYVGAEDVIVEVDGRTSLFRALPAVREGNTVEVDSKGGLVLRVVAENPIRAFDLNDLVTTHHDFEINASDIPDNLEDFEGAPDIRLRAEELIATSLAAGDRLKAMGAEPVKGALFWGPPGTGKTMLARILAKQFSAHFFHISGPEVFAALVGQSEGIIRKLFEDARSKAPAVIFFDEIDSVGGRRSDAGLHESSKKVVGQLLTEMDGFTPGSGILVIAATNLIEDVDPALLRPGRFTWKLEFRLPNRAGRLRILERQIESLSVGERLPLEEAAEMTDGWSPADLRAIWTEAAILAVRDERDTIFREDFLGGMGRVSRLGINPTRRAQPQ